MSIWHTGTFAVFASILQQIELLSLHSQLYNTLAKTAIASKPCFFWHKSEPFNNLRTFYVLHWSNKQVYFLVVEERRLVEEGSLSNWRSYTLQVYNSKARIYDTPSICYRQSIYTLQRFDKCLMSNLGFAGTLPEGSEAQNIGVKLDWLWISFQKEVFYRCKSPQVKRPLYNSAQHEWISEETRRTGFRIDSRAIKVSIITVAQKVKTSISVMKQD